MEYKDFTGDNAVKDVDVKGRTVTGYFASFGSKDLGGDIINKGAFSKTIQERGYVGSNDIYFLYQHDKKQLLGKPNILKEDDYGLYFESKVSNTTLGNDVLELYREGVLTKHSFGYQVIKHQKTKDALILKELKLYEGSAVTFPMNEAAGFTGLKALEDFLHNGKASDETFKMLEKLYKRIGEALELKSDDSTSERDLTDIDNFIKNL